MGPRRKTIVIAALGSAVAVGLGGTLFHATSRAEDYTARAILYISVEDPHDDLRDEVVVLGREELDACLEVARRPAIRTAVSEQLDLAPGVVSYRVRLALRPETTLIQVIAHDTSARRALTMADAYAEQARRHLDRPVEDCSVHRNGATVHATVVDPAALVED